ncbi:MAG TPA: hypothetical protein VM889_06105 [Candidatus Thermoplasmatota archaeon]|nr:hypothetical protein [Candidatus Thermoplasmatota archaeon]
MLRISSWLACALTIALVVPLNATADPNDVPDWVRSFAVGEAGTVALVWDPVVGAEAYRVYGVSSSGARTLIEETPANLHVTNHVYAGYAVSAVIDGAEGDAVAATNCIHVELRLGEIPPFLLAVECVPPP